MTFLEDWTPHYGDTLPLGHKLRDTYPDRWVRFHALPDSKRLPETRDEIDEILARANTLAASLFTAGAELWGVGCEYDARPPAPPFNFSHQIEEPDYYDDPVHIHVARMAFHPSAFDADFERMARDGHRILLFDPAKGRVLAPYDGGFDLFDPDVMRQHNRKMQFRAWLSDHPDGL